MLARPLASLVFILLLPSAYADTHAPSSQPIVFTSATIIDVPSGRSRPDMTIVVAGNRIVTLGESGEVRRPADARVIDASGKYVIPVLRDMHAHLGAGGAPIDIDMPLLVANGVTCIREMWSDCQTVAPVDCLGQRRTWQRQIAAVMLNGRYLDRTALDRLLSTAEAAASR